MEGKILKNETLKTKQVNLRKLKINWKDIKATKKLKKLMQNVARKKEKIALTMTNFENK